jgi:hypothetical protein
VATAVSLVTMANIAAKASMPTATQPVVLGADLGQGLEVEQLAIAGVSPQSGQTQSDASAVQQALTLIVGYIPTEIVVTYVAVVAAIESGATGSRVGQWVAFWFFLALSPSLCWVLYATNLRTQGRTTPINPKQWPRWPMVAATIAFAVWAYTLPETPFLGFSWYQPAVGTAALLTVTMLFGLLSPLLQPKPTKV